MPQDHLPFKEIEPKWQKNWADSGMGTAPKTPRQGKKHYCLVMFPYPSGRLHMGHMRNYTIGDVIARFKRMQGLDVLHPIGWDAFGMPAENAAIQHKIDPAQWTRSNISVMRQQLQSLGLSYDWQREFATCDPAYYRWNQWIFIRLYEKGLAYRKKSPVNFCPKCRTVLANEQVTAEGLCWRCDSEVEQKELEQWFLKLTAYADALLEDHRLLEKGWPPEVLQMQKNWIGKSEGAEIQFETSDNSSLAVFTTRPDTIFGATFMVLAPEHPLLRTLTATSQKKEVDRYVTEAKRLTSTQRTRQEREKIGVFTGSYAVNPATQSSIPIWVSDYVLMDYGTGAIMAVPAHDQRDLEFARKHRLEIVPVIQSPDSSWTPDQGAYEGEGKMVHSGPFDGLSSIEAKKKISEWLASQGKAVPKVRYHLKDWLISRQRAWGTPIPVVYCDRCGTLPVPEKDLPVLLPENVPYTGTGESPLAKAEGFFKTSCPKCGSSAKRETDTMDTFVDSSWYYARYCDPKNSSGPFDPPTAKAWLPVDQYIGGIEHACMHLIYARFFHKVLRDIGLLEDSEPFTRLLTQGMVTLGGTAMSKSRGNVVDPQTILDKYGADTARLFILFAAPPQKSLEWSEEGVEGCWRFLNRVWRLAQKIRELPAGPEDSGGETIFPTTHRTIRRVTRDLDQFGFNTAIAALMELTNLLVNYPRLGDAASGESVRLLVRMLAPFAPHAAEEMWSVLGESGSVFWHPWPAPDDRWLRMKKIQIVVQINGKVRDHLEMEPGAPESDVIQKALELPHIRPNVSKESIVKTIYVPEKLVNLVVKSK